MCIVSSSATGDYSKIRNHLFDGTDEKTRRFSQDLQH